MCILFFQLSGSRGLPEVKLMSSALSAYMFFVQDWRQRIIAENPDASFGEIGKLLGARWKEMPDNEKKVCLLSS